LVMPDAMNPPVSEKLIFAANGIYLTPALLWKRNVSPAFYAVISQLEFE
jgi:hypothetical protein